MDFATLEEVGLREAWAHEAAAFTPWLAANLDRLGKVLGIPLELGQAEVPVGRYAADILARNTRDGSVVLIENQLEWSDHGHLGQLLTYLTGLKAETVVWVAQDFREEHLSALRWLNESTVDPFAFFAVKVRVVRIGQSPLAPLFEVVERPNGWDRHIQEIARSAQAISPTGELRRAFWAHYSKRILAAAADVAAGGGVSRWRAVAETGLVISQWLAADGVGVFIRGGRGLDGEAVYDRLSLTGGLQERLGVAPGNNRKFPFNQRLEADLSNEADWDRLADWLHARTQAYSAALAELLPKADDALSASGDTLDGM